MSHNTKKVLSDSDAKRRLEELSIKIRKYDESYYLENESIITDAEYDVLRYENTQLEKLHPNLIREDSPNLRVGISPGKSFKTVKHLKPMLSLNNAYTEEEVEKFYKNLTTILRHNEIKIAAETKVDGLSASLRYKNSKLSIALTRGDGELGEDITNNIVYVRGVLAELPKNLPPELEVRGEIYMPNKTFYLLNKERKEKGLPLFSNPRNAASGSIRNLNPQVTKSRNLSFYCYTIIDDSLTLGSKISEIRDKLNEIGFETNEPFILCNSIKEMIDFYKHVNSIRSKLSYDIDGIVYKLESIEDHHYLGETNRWPKWALAHKFAAIEKQTKVLNITLQVGRTGIITPVAELEEVNISGVNVNRATLHNEDEIIRLDIRLGDIVKIKRAGDVIPKIISVDVTLRDKNSKKYIFPSNCPSCGTKTIRMIDEAHRRCANINYCDAQLLAKFNHFVSRDAFDITGLGDKQLKLLWNKKIIKNFVDIFRLEQMEKSNLISLKDLPGWGDKTLKNLFASINLKRFIDYNRLIYSLGINHIGKETAGLLADKYNPLNNLIDTCKNASDKSSSDWKSLSSINGVGPKVIKSLSKYFSNLDSVYFLNELINELKVNYRNIGPAQGSLKGSNIVFTGKLLSMTRIEAQKKAKQNGAAVSSFISSKINLLVLGEGKSSKLEKAVKLNIKIINEKEFIKITEV